jgi:hypothetical protein
VDQYVDELGVGIKPRYPQGTITTIKLKRFSFIEGLKEGLDDHGENGQDLKKVGNARIRGHDGLFEVSYCCGDRLRVGGTYEIHECVEW